MPALGLPPPALPIAVSPAGSPTPHPHPHPPRYEPEHWRFGDPAGRDTKVNYMRHASGEPALRAPPPTRRCTLMRGGPRCSGSQRSSLQCQLGDGGWRLSAAHPVSTDTCLPPHPHPPPPPGPAPSGQIYGMSRPVARYIAQVRPAPGPPAGAARSARPFLPSWLPLASRITGRCLVRYCSPTRMFGAPHCCSIGKICPCCCAILPPAAPPPCRSSRRRRSAFRSPPRRTRPSCTGMPTRTWRWAPG